MYNKNKVDYFIDLDKYYPSIKMKMSTLPYT